jgi:hypothetical protein
MRFRMMTVLFVFALFVAACGGGTDSTADSTQAGSSTTQQTDSGSSTTPTSDQGGGASTDVANASVTVDGTTYNFIDDGQPGQTCTEFFGIVQVVLSAVDSDGNTTGGGGISIIINVEDPGGEASVKFADKPNGVDYFADPEGRFPDGKVDSFTGDSHHVEGTATFIALQDSDQSTSTVTGTFEATCPEE